MGDSVRGHAALQEELREVSPRGGSRHGASRGCFFGTIVGTERGPLAVGRMSVQEGVLEQGRWVGLRRLGALFPTLGAPPDSSPPLIAKNKEPSLMCRSTWLTASKPSPASLHLATFSGVHLACNSVPSQQWWRVCGPCLGLGGPCQGRSVWGLSVGLPCMAATAKCGSLPMCPCCFLLPSCYMYLLSTY